MKKITSIFTALCLGVLLVQCESGSDSQAEAGYAKYDQESPPVAESADVTAPDDLTETQNRKLVKEGSLRFETGDLSETHLRLTRAVQKHKGYISRDEVYKGDNSVEYTLEVRIPAANFDAFLEEVSTGVDHFDIKQIMVRDVTGQYVDLSARLKTKKELEERYLQLLRQASSVKDILEIEKELATLRSDIESMEALLKIMDSQIAYSTLNIQFYVNQIEPSQGMFFKLKQGLVNGWDNLLSFMIGLVNIWPFLIIVPVVFVLIRRRFKKVK